MQQRLTKSLFIAMILLVFLITACVSPDNLAATSISAPSDTSQTMPLKVKDGLGREIEVTTPYQHIVSLAPSNTEILFAIGAGKQIIGRDSFSDYPKEAQQIRDIGGGFTELDAETIISVQPDLILASSLTPIEQIQALQDFGLNVFVLVNPRNFEGLYGNLHSAAELTGHVPEAEKLIDTMRNRVAAIVSKTGQITDRPLVFYELDGTDPNAPWTPGPDTFIDMLISMAGGDNIGKNLKGEWVQISIEELIVRDPKIILLGDAYWGGVTPESVASRTGWEALSAVKEGRVYPFDDNLVSRPGPRLIEGLEALARFFHPELF